jgi:hypothetical protein
MDGDFPAADGELWMWLFIETSPPAATFASSGTSAWISVAWPRPDPLRHSHHPRRASSAALRVSVRSPMLPYPASVRSLP